jgi:hypothetical protein
MSLDATDQTLKTLLRPRKDRPLERLQENDDWVGLDTFQISKHRAVYSDGWTADLRSESCAYKRWFDFRDIDMRGWAVMFHIFDPLGDQSSECEQFLGWVPPDRVADADRWLDVLNEQVRARLRARTAGSAESQRDNG